MNLRKGLITKIISTTILFFFLWSSGGIFNLAYAATKDSGQGSVASGQKKDKSVEERFQEALERIRDAADKEDSAKVKAERAEIEKLDVDIKKQFKETEQKIKDLPEVIKQRHRDFVKNYEENLNTLKTNLDAIDKAKTKEEKKQALQKTKEFLEKTKTPSRHVPLDPNKLPHRTVEPKFKEPRLKKEDFEKEFGSQKAQIPLSPPLIKGEGFNNVGWAVPTENVSRLTSHVSPIIVASNGPLTGLVSSLPPFQGEGWGEGISPNTELLTPNLVVAAATDPLASSGQSLPTSDDLTETIEVQFTDDIKAKAAQLNNNPVKIYEYVKNNFIFEPYYGSLKDSQETFLQKAGNDFDQASFLISLLRASNIPARYVYGTVEMPIEKVKKWLGVENDNVVGEIIASNGIPVSFVQEGGKISKVRLEHVWVEAWVSYDNYRGQPKSQNKTWIPLDPSFKQVQYTRGPDIKQIMNFDPSAFMYQLKTNSTYSPTDYYVSNVSETFIQQKLQEYQNNFQNYISANIPNATPQDLIGKFDILYEKFGILPASLPYKIIAKGATYSDIPDILRHKLQINIKSATYFDFFGTGDINYQSNLAQLAGKKITISYMPASTSDETTLKSYGALSATPAYLVNMEPVLMMDGISVATGGEIGLGNAQQINLTFSSPNISTDVVNHTLTSGGYHAIGLDLQRIPKALLQKQTGRMQAMQSYLNSILSGNPSIPPSGDTRDNLIGDMLYDAAINYFYNLDALNDLMSRVTDIILVRQPSEAMAFMDLKVSTIFGIPLSATIAGMSIDVSRNVISPFSMAGDKNIENAFKVQSGIYTSAMEHIIFEWMFNVSAVSTVKILQQANKLSIPVYIVTNQNMSQVLPNVQVADSIKIEIQNAVNAGMIVIIPKTEITLNNWKGTGYIVQNPTTMDGAYRISGGINGGSTTCLAEGTCYFNETHPCILPEHATNPWKFLLDDIDKLLAVANILLLGEVELQSMADELCALLQGISPSAPRADFAENILEQFRFDVSLMVIAITATQIPIFTGVIDLFLFAAQALLLRHYGFDGNVFAYAGYFTIHYLHEYIILFRVGLISAFSDF